MAKKETPNTGFSELKQSLKAKELGRLYFFYGEETFLLNYYLEQVKKQTLDGLTEAFNFHRFNSETFSLDALAEAVENLPMMAEKTLVQVEDIDLFKMNEADRERAAEILKDIPEYCTVVFTYLTEQWKPDKRLKKLWEVLDKVGTPVEFARQDTHQLVAWIARHFAAHKKKISNSLAEYLINITGGTMTALSGEIEKICAYSGADEIVKADIDAVVEPVLDAVVFQMTDCLAQGEYAQALQILKKLLQMQQEPLAILGAIGAQFRRLSAARTLIDRGRGQFDLQKLCGLPEYPARLTMTAARKVDAALCRRAVKLVMDTDYKMKTSFDDPERLLELLILELAAEGRHG